MANKNPISKIKLPNDTNTYDVKDNTLVGSSNISITTNETTGERSIDIPTTADPSIYGLTTSADINVGGDIVSNYVKSPDNSNVYVELSSTNAILTSNDSSDWGFYTNYLDNSNSIGGTSGMYVDGGTGFYTSYSRSKSTNMYTYSAYMSLNGDDWVTARVYGNVPSGQTLYDNLYLGNGYPQKIQIEDNDSNYIILNSTDNNIVFGIGADDIAYINATGLDMNSYDISNVDNLHTNKAIINEKVIMQYNSTDDSLDFIFN